MFDIYSSTIIFDIMYRAHKDQERKYTGEPYISHPLEVALSLEYGENKLSAQNYDNLIGAALLHDVFEDSDLGIYGPLVAEEDRSYNRLDKRDPTYIIYSHIIEANRKYNLERILDLSLTVSLLTKTDNQSYSEYLKDLCREPFTTKDILDNEIKLKQYDPSLTREVSLKEDGLDPYRLNAIYYCALKVKIADLLHNRDSLIVERGRQISNNKLPIHPKLQIKIDKYTGALKMLEPYEELFSKFLYLNNSLPTN